MIGYLVVVATMAAGYIGAPWWLLFVGGSCLAALQISEQRPLWGRLVTIGGTEARSHALLASLSISGLTGIGAFGCGRLISLVAGAIEAQLRAVV
jgi:hypothetical protein